jgi:hypothetical protein
MSRGRPFRQIATQSPVGQWTAWTRPGISLDISNGWTWGAALLTIVSRLIYVPVFYLGIPVARTMVWAPSFVAIPALAAGILIGAA